jgi:hypothetical protein
MQLTMAALDFLHSSHRPARFPSTYFQTWISLIFVYCSTKLVYIYFHHKKQIQINRKETTCQQHILCIEMPWCGKPSSLALALLLCPLPPTLPICMQTQYVNRGYTKGSGAAITPPLLVTWPPPVCWHWHPRAVHPRSPPCSTCAGRGHIFPPSVQGICATLPLHANRDCGAVCKRYVPPPSSPPHPCSLEPCPLMHRWDPSFTVTS